MAASSPRVGFSPPDEFDDYEVVRPLGNGAVGQVFLATDIVLARQVALKFLAVQPDPAARQRFLLEARASARIQHPNVVNIYRVGELGEHPYIVSELVRGRTLADTPRPIPESRVLAIAIDLARGLAAAHRSGVVHCDIKPSNIMVTEDGVAKLVDFGLAQVVRDGGLTTAMAMTGTPDYMAPEVWRNQAPTRRSDVYSFGAVLYELVQGAAPHSHVAPHELADAVQSQDPRPLAGDPRLAAVIARCLARDPEYRFASGDDVREVLEQVNAARLQAVGADINPYRGLRPFEASHRGVFFGRGIEVAAIVDRLRTDAVVVVAGDSGVGKSSLCRAGVVPALVDGALGPGRTWTAITLVPGRHPLAALAAAFGDPTLGEAVRADPRSLAHLVHRRAVGTGIVVLVDQLEELVTVADPDEAGSFEAALAALSEGVAGVKVIATVRSDFLARLIALPRLGEELSRLLYFVRALPPERIRDVITGPSAATNVAFESDAMVTDLVDGTASAGAGGLPLLSFALAELWEAHDRARKLITRATLDSIGGVAGALAHHANTVIAGLTPAVRADARRVLLRLVTAEGTRVRRSDAELAVGPDSSLAIASLVKGRLVVAHDGEVGTLYEIAHEVLVRGWATLREWLDDDVVDRARRERLALAVTEWERVGRRGDVLWRGARLVEALALKSHGMTPPETAFLTASTRSQRRREWWLRGAIATVLVLVLTAYGITRFVAARRTGAAVGRAIAAARAELGPARAEHDAQQALAAQALARFDAGASPDAESTWSRVLALRVSSARHYRSASRSIEQALALDPERADIRALLGDVLLERALLAETMRDDEIRDEVIGRLPEYDTDGSRRARWERPAALTVHAPAAATVSLDGRELGRGAQRLELGVGAHVVEVRAGGDPIRAPIFATWGATLEVTLAPPPRVPNGFVYVPPGEFLYGSAADEDTRKTFYSTAPLHPRRTSAYLIARHEVTFGEWIEFVEAQAADLRAPLIPNLPIKSGNAVVLEPGAAGWTLALQPVAEVFTARTGEPIRYAGRPTRSTQDWSRFPVLGISALEAEAYAAWLDRTGRVPGARLCSEVEWERAARGADGREYPAGHAPSEDEINIDSTYSHDLMGPDEVGSHPASTSPFGLDDMCGNAFEWTRADTGPGFVARGGGYSYDRKQANLANRTVLASDYQEASLGARLCITPATTPPVP